MGYVRSAYSYKMQSLGVYLWIEITGNDWSSFKKESAVWYFVFLSIHNDIGQLEMPPPLIARLENYNRIKYVKNR